MKKRPPPVPYPKNFSAVFIASANESKDGKVGFPAHFHFAVRRKFICSRGKQISSAIRGFHLSASADKFHCMRHHAARPARVI